MTLTRRDLLAVLAISVLAAHSADAAERLPYDAQTFGHALQTGRPIVVHVTASWCSECKLQKPIVARLAERTEFKDLLIVDVDFDAQKEALRALHVQMQSTLLAFKDTREVVRLVGDTSAEAIESVMRRAL